MNSDVSIYAMGAVSTVSSRYFSPRSSQLKKKITQKIAIFPLRKRFSHRFVAIHFFSLSNSRSAAAESSHTSTFEWFALNRFISKINCVRTNQIEMQRRTFLSTQKLYKRWIVRCASYEIPNWGNLTLELACRCTVQFHIQMYTNNWQNTEQKRWREKKNNESNAVIWLSLQFFFLSRQCDLMRIFAPWRTLTHINIRRRKEKTAIIFKSASMICECKSNETILVWSSSPMRLRSTTCYPRRRR